MRAALCVSSKSWRRLDGHNQLPKVILGVKFTAGIEAVRSRKHKLPPGPFAARTYSERARGPLNAVAFQG